MSELTNLRLLLDSIADDDGILTPHQIALANKAALKDFKSGRVCRADTKLILGLLDSAERAGRDARSEQNQFDLDDLCDPISDDEDDIIERKIREVADPENPEAGA